MWFMYDVAPAYFYVVACELLNVTYDNHWIGQGELNWSSWAARSPLFPMRSFDNFRFTTPVEKGQDLINRIIDWCNVIRNTAHVFG